MQTEVITLINYNRNYLNGEVLFS